MHHYRSCEGVNTGFSGMGSPVLKVGKELRNLCTYRTISLFLSTNHRSYIFIDWSDLFIVQNGVIEDDSILSFQRKVIAALSVFQVLVAAFLFLKLFSKNKVFTQASLKVSTFCGESWKYSISGARISSDGNLLKIYGCSTLIIADQPLLYWRWE